MSSSAPVAMVGGRPMNAMNPAEMYAGYGAPVQYVHSPPPVNRSLSYVAQAAPQAAPQLQQQYGMAYMQPGSQMTLNGAPLNMPYPNLYQTSGMMMPVGMGIGHAVAIPNIAVAERSDKVALSHGSARGAGSHWHLGHRQPSSPCSTHEMEIRGKERAQMRFKVSKKRTKSACC
mmetsp:Transcript_66591/g.171366  ORF Transcript_66591/g.171366 Transcript_66591/m.171366 type:complete len:174 (+) Transcript_66591:73-594(+)